MTDFGESPYAVLEVARGAAPPAIDAAYRRLHGLLDDGALASYGMLDGADVGQLRHQLDQAYALLSDPVRRANFDRTGEVEPQMGAARPAAPGASAPQAQAQGPSGAGASELARAAAANLAAKAAPQPQPQPQATGAGAVRRAPVPGRPTLAVPLLAEVAEDARYDGPLLRALRESAKVSIDELSEWTKIGRRYLIAIENDDFALLPAKVYVRGFVGEIARVFGFDVPRVTRSYLEGYSAWSADN